LIRGKQYRFHWKHLVVRSLVAVTVISVLFFSPSGEEDHKVEGSRLGMDGLTEVGCKICHGHEYPYIAVQLEVVGVDENLNYTPGEKYTILIDIPSGPEPEGDGGRGGFDLKVSAGTLSVPDGTNKVQITEAGKNKKDTPSGKVNEWNTTGEGTHTYLGSRSRHWELEWRAPPTGTGVVTFWVMGVASNGDSINNTSLTYDPGYTGDLWGGNLISLQEGPFVESEEQFEIKKVAPIDTVLVFGIVVGIFLVITVIFVLVALNQHRTVEESEMLREKEREMKWGGRGERFPKHGVVGGGKKKIDDLTDDRYYSKKRENVKRQGGRGPITKKVECPDCGAMVKEDIYEKHRKRAHGHGGEI